MSSDTSKHYTNEDAQKAVQLSCPCGSVAQHDPRQNQECAWALDLGLAVVEHIAPTIAARALREAADSLTWRRPEVCPCTNPEACCGSVESCDAMQPSVFTVGPKWLRNRADEIEAGR